MKEDLKDFNIKNTFDQISKLKADTFKKQVARACKNYTLTKLINEKEKHSKGENLKYKELKTQKYLLSNKLTSSEAKFLFKIRSRMLDVRANFSGMYKNNLTCQVCFSHTDNQESILSCSALQNSNKLLKYNDLFSENLDVVLPILKQFRKLWRKRETLLKK